MTLTELRALWDERDHRYGRRGYLDDGMLAALLEYRTREIRGLPGQDQATAYHELRGRREQLAGGRR